MKYKYLILILLTILSLTGCPSKTVTTTPPVPQAPPIVETPSPQSSPTVYSINDIQTVIAKTCGTCGDTGGPVNTATATYTQTPNVASAPLPNSGKVTMFDIAGKNPYANAYWYWPHTAPTSKKVDFTYDFNMYIPAEALLASQAIEWEMQLDNGGLVYNFAYQLNWHQKLIKTFDKATRSWQPTKYPTTLFTPDNWHHIVMHNIYDTTTKTLNMITLQVDYTVYNINVVKPAPPTSQSGLHFTNAFQLDSNGKTPPTPYKVYVDKMRLTYYELTN